MTLVSLEPAASWSRVKHSTTEPLRSHTHYLLTLKYVTVYYKTIDCQTTYSRESFVNYDFLNQTIHDKIDACRFFENFVIAMQ